MLSKPISLNERPPQTDWTDRTLVVATLLVVTMVLVLGTMAVFESHKKSAVSPLPPYTTHTTLQDCIPLNDVYHLKVNSESLWFFPRGGGQQLVCVYPIPLAVESLSIEAPWRTADNQPIRQLFHVRVCAWPGEGSDTQRFLSLTCAATSLTPGVHSGILTLGWIVPQHLRTPSAIPVLVNISVEIPRSLEDGWPPDLFIEPVVVRSGKGE